MSKYLIDDVVSALNTIGYGVLNIENKPHFKQIRFKNSFAVLNIYDTGTVVVQGQHTEKERLFLKAFIEKQTYMQYIDNAFNIKMIELINQKREEDYYDYKEQWSYKDESYRLVHDILCLANNISNQEAYLIFGVSNDGTVVGLNGPIDSAYYADIMSKVDFAGDRRPEVVFSDVLYKDNLINVICILPTDTAPFYLNTNFGKLRANFIYTRDNAKNTAIDSSATFEQVVAIWSCRIRGEEKI